MLRDRSRPIAGASPGPLQPEPSVASSSPVRVVVVVLDLAISVDAQAAALDATLPDSEVIVVAARWRWRPPFSGIPPAYRAERSRALAEVWEWQIADARDRVAEACRALARPGRRLRAHVAFGDATRVARDLAGSHGAETIIRCVVPPEARLGRWPRRSRGSPGPARCVAVAERVVPSPATPAAGHAPGGDLLA